MRSHILVCPGDAPYLARLHGYACVLEVETETAADRAIADAARIGILLHAVALRTDEPVGRIDLHAGWGRAPMALFATSLGAFPDVVPRLDALRRLNARVYLPVDRPENVTGLRILASLGVACAALPGPGPVDWDALADLASYALLGLVPRGTIEPFQTLARDYRPEARSDVRAYVFDDPARFVHADWDGRLAFGAAERAAGRFFGEDLDLLDRLDEVPAYQARLNAWRLVFLSLNACSTCPGWRLCGGFWTESPTEETGCRGFADELIGLVEQRRWMPGKGEPVWQP